MAASGAGVKRLSVIAGSVVSWPFFFLFSMTTVTIIAKAIMRRRTDPLTTIGATMLYSSHTKFLTSENALRWQRLCGGSNAQDGEKVRYVGQQVQEALWYVLGIQEKVLLLFAAYALAEADV